MVHFTKVLFSGKKNLKHFIDNLRIYVRGGIGGLGLSKYGGIGGKGGHVYVVGSMNSSLKRIKSKYPEKRFIASNGINSSGRTLQGPPGEDLIIECPPGITIRTDEGFVFGEIIKEKDKILVAKGGTGGGLHNGFIGEKGHAHVINLDLKLIADIGLVGFPNAGKSTLLKCLSRATPKIASYPFTTIAPRIGVLEYDDHRQITMADLPGLIEGAHINVGMGHTFLKHVERTKMILMIVDCHGFRLNPMSLLRSSFENIVLLNKELELYKDELCHKPAILVINKIDTPGSDLKVYELLKNLENIKESLASLEETMRPQKLIHFEEVITISAKQSSNTDYLKSRLRQLLDMYNDSYLKEKFKENEFKQLANIESALKEHISLKGV